MPPSLFVLACFWALLDTTSATGAYGLRNLKVASCTINKAGSTVVNRIMHALNGITDAKVLEGLKLRGENAFESFANESLQEILNDPSWTKFVVLREPAERFASGFQHKCIRGPRGKVFTLCPEINSELMEDIDRVVSAVESMAFRALKTNTKIADSHFRPISEDCDLFNSSWKYSIVIYDYLEDDIIDVVSTIPTITEERRRDVINAIHALFPEDITKLKRMGNRAPPGSSAALANDWNSDIKYTSKDIIPRLRSIYAHDYAIYEHYKAQHTSRIKLHE